MAVAIGGSGDGGCVCGPSACLSLKIMLGDGFVGLVYSYVSITFS